MDGDGDANGVRAGANKAGSPREQRIAESAYLLWKNAGMPEGRSGEFWRAAFEQEARREERPATDIAAMLEVIRRRPHGGSNAHLEVYLTQGESARSCKNWRLDLTMTDLCGASLNGAHLAGAFLSGAHLEGADLSGAIGDAETRLPAGVARPADWPPYAP